MGKHCRDIIESRHVDVMEMDAASNTSINDIREIIDRGSRYRPVMARYKVYIIDEVHMLSTAAFNGLLKTLEEPPEHVKFIFATTEIRKCRLRSCHAASGSTCGGWNRRSGGPSRPGVRQRERGDRGGGPLHHSPRGGRLGARFALALDQAIAHGGGKVGAEEVRRLLGLADRARVIDLFEAVMSGDPQRALKEFRDQYDSGADPAVILADLAEFTHLVTCFKLVPETAADASLVQAERERGADFAARLLVRDLSRVWQMLLKGMAETQSAAKPAQRRKWCWCALHSLPICRALKRRCASCATWGTCRPERRSPRRLALRRTVRRWRRAPCGRPSDSPGACPLRPAGAAPQRRPHLSRRWRTGLGWRGSRISSPWRWRGATC